VTPAIQLRLPARQQDERIGEADNRQPAPQLDYVMNSFTWQTMPWICLKHTNFYVHFMRNGAIIYLLIEGEYRK
jgi:hypothetical protein